MSENGLSLVTVYRLVSFTALSMVDELQATVRGGGGESPVEENFRVVQKKKRVRENPISRNCPVDRTPQGDRLEYQGIHGDTRRLFYINYQLITEHTYG